MKSKIFKYLSRTAALKWSGILESFRKFSKIHDSVDVSSGILGTASWKLALLGGLLLLASCDFTQMPDSVQAYTMHLSDYEVTVMVGDTVEVTCVFEPDSVTAPKAFWHKTSPNIAIENPTGYTCQVIGTQAGDAWVYAVTLNYNIQDSCLVYVTPTPSTFDPTDYEYDMFIYADVEIDGTHNDPRYTAMAYLDEQIRGVGKIVTTKGVTCTVLRVWHHNKSGREFKLRYFDNEKHVFGDLDYEFDFDGAAHGTPTDPIKIKQVDSAIDQ